MPGRPANAATECLAVAGGAIAGATARWGAGEIVTARPGGLPVATLAINVIGCALAGLAAARLERGSLAWLTVVTGVLGGFTTFSTSAADTRALLAGGRPELAGVYVVVSFGAGLAVTAGARRARRPKPAHP